MRDDVNIGQVLATSVWRWRDETRPLDSEIMLTVERRVQGLACSAQAALCQPDPLADWTTPSWFDDNLRASAVPGSTGGVAVINLGIAVVGNLTAESLGLSC